MPEELLPLITSVYHLDRIETQAPSICFPPQTSSPFYQLLNDFTMPLVRLQPHLFTSLPAHSSLQNNEPRPELQSYIRTALQEALELLHSVPSSFTADPKLRSSSPSEAKIKLLRNWRKLPEDASQKDKKPEFWVCRQSEHVDAEAKGTASWSEFETGLRSNHAEHEMDYTPSVTGVERLLEWSRNETGEVEVEGLVFKDVDVESM